MNYKLIRYFLDILPNVCNDILLEKYETNFFFNDKKLMKILFFLKKHTLFQFKSLMEYTCIDELCISGVEKRFLLFINVLSPFFNNRLNLHFLKSRAFPSSLGMIYRASGWLEREIWDLFGIIFAGHNDLRRIMSDYGFFGSPPRKDFPVTGYVEYRFNESRKRIIKLELSMVQEFRDMDLINPWTETI